MRHNIYTDELSLEFSGLRAAISVSGGFMVAKRARRISDKNRMKAKAKRVYPSDETARNADHLKSCSCFICGNPRKWWKQKTIAENMADDWRRLQRDWSKVYG